MKITHFFPSGSTDSVFEIEHDGKILTFPGGIYDKMAYGPTPLFTELNEYFALLAPMRQFAIFGTYAAAKAVWDVLSAEPNSNGKVLTSIGAILVKQLYDQLNWKQLTVRLLNENKLNYLMDEADHAAYTQAEYVQLLVLVVALQAAAPLFAKHVVLTQPIVGITMAPVYALQLLADSSVMEIPAMKKLQAYIEAVAPEVDDTFTMPLADFTYPDYLEWIVAHAVVRRVCAYVPGNDQSLLTQLREYIRAKSTLVAVAGD